MKPYASILLVWLLSSCATTPQTTIIETSAPADISPVAELVDTPFFPQQQYQCGPAALATMLKHRGLEISPEELVDKVYIPERKGSLQIEMLAATRAYGHVGYRIRPSLPALLREIDAGNPVLVMQNLAFDIIPRWHYAVVVGYDIPSSEIVLRSGRVQRHVVGMATFERTWQRADHWAIVIMDVDELPRTAEPGPYAGLARDMELTGLQHKARRMLDAALQRWPDASILLMATGNMELSAGNPVTASRYFMKELELRPRNPAAWNNLAYALADQGCTHAARNAVNCAATLAPTDPNIDDSLRELGMNSADGMLSCPSPACPVSPGH